MTDNETCGVPVAIHGVDYGEQYDPCTKPKGHDGHHDPSYHIADLTAGKDDDGCGCPEAEPLLGALAIVQEVRAALEQALNSGVLMHAIAPGDTIKTRTRGVSADGAEIRSRLIEGMLADQRLSRLLMTGAAVALLPEDVSLHWYRHWLDDDREAKAWRVSLPSIQRNRKFYDGDTPAEAVADALAAKP